MRFIKEALIEGRHIHPTLGCFAVNARDLPHVVESFGLLREAGYVCPFQLEHGRDATKLGRVVGLRVGRNAAGRATLLAEVDIPDQRHAARFTSKDWDVSVAIGPVKHGSTHHAWSLQHLAATKHPVVKPLGPWRAVQGDAAGEAGKQSTANVAASTKTAAAAKAKPTKSSLVADAERRQIRALARKGASGRAMRQKVESNFLRGVRRQSRAGKTK